jgi:hypothetical protein
MRLLCGCKGTKNKTKTEAKGFQSNCDANAVYSLSNFVAILQHSYSHYGDKHKELTAIAIRYKLIAKRLRFNCDTIAKRFTRRFSMQLKVTAKQLQSDRKTIKMRLL